MSNKFTGITSAGSAIPVYDKDAHSALEQKLDTSAFSSVSGNFLTEVPESAVSGFATHEEVESATSGKADTSGVVDYTDKPSANAIYASGNQFVINRYTNGSDVLINKSGMFLYNAGISASQAPAEYASAAPAVVFSTAGFLASAGRDEPSPKLQLNPFGLNLSGQAGQPSYYSAGISTAIGPYFINSGGTHVLSAKANASGVVDYNNKPSANAISADDHTLYIKNEYGAGGEVLANNSGFYVHGMQSNYGFIAGCTPYNSRNAAPITNLYANGIESKTNPGNPSALNVSAGWAAGGLQVQYTQSGFSAGVTTGSGVYQIDQSGTHYLSAKQDISAMTAYQPVGDYQPSGDYLSASESENFYPMTGNPSGFLTEHQSLDGLMQTSGLEYDGDKISGYMGSAFKAGTDLEFEYDSADNISAINSSAISTTPSQALYAKSPLFAGVSGTSSFIGIDETVLTQLIESAASARYNETVLWEGDATPNGLTAIAQLSEPISAFDSYEVYCSFESMYPPKASKFETPSAWTKQPNTDVYFGGIADAVSWKPNENNAVMHGYFTLGFGTNLTDFYCISAVNIDVGAANGATAIRSTYGAGLYHVYKVVGINRKEA